METAIDVGTYLAAVGGGLIAGLFYTFSFVAMRSIATLRPPNGMKAMQSINIEILNPAFFVVFLGTAILSVVLGLAAVLDQPDSGRWYLLAGSILYLLGAIVVTGAFNVPLNNELAAADADDPESERIWTNYLDVWTRWNHARTVLCTAAFIAFMLSLTH